MQTEDGGLGLPVEGVDLVKHYLNTIDTNALFLHAVIHFSILFCTQFIMLFSGQTNSSL